jgi:hypothetical protein
MRLSDSRTPILSLVLNVTISEQKRQKVIENILPIITPAINKRLDEFEQIPLSQQVVRLDAVIDQMQAFRKDHPQGISSAERFNMIT